MASNQSRVRIIGGSWRSRMITFPFRSDLRPTPDRVRETLFNWLGQSLSGMRCLDLFSGSGVLGFEAASRGAAQVVMVESDSAVFQSLQKNKKALEADRVDLVQMNALTFLIADMRRFDLIFLDPPYRRELLPGILPQLPQRLAKGGQVYIEGGQHCTFDELWRVRRKGQAGKVNYQLLELSLTVESNG
ncbi:16S rRNA (guanine(966)-N(2))-methyltransferase RsmD [Nitrosomonas sp. Nm51]|uniref:16S rRNA (guanine(966)-N(2))-methyltransferase RsmD n=1 Tax=Nitrosomonas sp. Nm51 TaxID=133720 RepID=UPI0008AC7F43|nr:16S rRNA (guanine(966)-N(2))-methyltransferase RsmD [Nitrosomonas sp. Nm51]SEQ86576.1 16S rRNA (guanine(966)-N(2))-methyltransferase RsmD [Nitrosomonas sp. Nm51]